MRHLFRLSAMAAAVATAAAAPLAAQTNSFVAGTQFNGPAITGSATSGALMAGMTVSVDFTDTPSASGAWGDLGGGTCGVNFGGFTLTLGCGSDTFNTSWSVNNATSRGVRSIRLNGASGRTVFDCGWTGSSCNNTGTGPLDGTVNSADGRSLTSFGGSYTGGVVGQYSNLFGVNGAAPVGDLFEQLTITFSDVLGAGGTYQFRADADNSSFDAPPPVAVPEPATLALTLVGLIGMGSVARRRRR
jgi:hypothetical protein